ARALGLAGGGAAADRCPGAGGSGLTGLGGKGRDEGGLMSETAAGSLQVVGADAPFIPPERRRHVWRRNGGVGGPCRWQSVGQGSAAVGPRRPAGSRSSLAAAAGTPTTSAAPLERHGRWVLPPPASAARCMGCL